MKKQKKYIAAFLPGAVYGVLVILLSQWLIRGLGGIIALIGTAADLDSGTISYITQIADQLKAARIVSPWLAFILIGAAVGALFVRWFSRPGSRQKVICICLGAILILPLILIAVWFTEINDVYAGALLGNLLPMLDAL